ncbi:MAG: hypothetical protein CO070_00465 [Gallionellales bacterium CG_4_9_14_0_8_um_filter_55_61]|nr:MAG: hypothetical protein CO070_00465 [Gallionellales bacterium CG_4_9_14_0_8_um_filter_55_61]
MMRARQQQAQKLPGSLTQKWQFDGLPKHYFQLPMKYNAPGRSRPLGRLRDDAHCLIRLQR